MPIHTHFFRRAILTRKAGQTDLVCFWCAIRVHARCLCIHCYKSVCASISATVLNIQTHRQTSFWLAYMNSSSSRAKNLEKDSENTTAMPAVKMSFSNNNYAMFTIFYVHFQLQKSIRLDQATCLSYWLYKISEQTKSRFRHKPACPQIKGK